MTQIIKVKQTLYIWKGNRTSKLKSSQITVYIHHINGIIAQDAVWRGHVSSTEVISICGHWFTDLCFILSKVSVIDFLWYNELILTLRQGGIKVYSILNSACFYFLKSIHHKNQILNFYCNKGRSCNTNLSFQIDKRYFWDNLFRLSKICKLETHNPYKLYLKKSFYLLFLINFHWHIVDLQWCINFRGTANQSVIHISTLFFFIYFY